MGKLIFLCAALSMGYVSLYAQKPQVLVNPRKALKALTLIEICKRETGAEPASLRRQFTNKNLTDVGTKQFLHCLYEKAEIITSDGNVIPEKIAEYYPSDVSKSDIHTAVKICKQEDGTPMDKVYNFVKCYHSVSPVDFIMQ